MIEAAGNVAAKRHGHLGRTGMMHRTRSIRAYSNKQVWVLQVVKDD